MWGEGITALLEHKFDVSKIETMGRCEHLYSPVTSVVHNGVNLTFQLYISKDANQGRIGLYIQYVDGPTELQMFASALLVAKGPQRVPVKIAQTAETVFTSKNEYLHSGNGSLSTLPNTLERLRAQGYVGHDSVMLHAFAVLSIREFVFEDPHNLCPASSVQNQFRHRQFGEIGTPTTTNSPLSNRIELISNDGQRFWVHKDVLAFNSDAFKHMFDPDKPEEARFKYLWEGKMTMKNVSGGALNEMLSFIYLKYTTPDFNQFAVELVPVADMYELKGLGVLCHQALVGHTKNEKDITELLRMLDVSRLHKLNELEKVCVHSLKNVITDEKLTVPDVLKVAAQAKKYDLNDLLVACGQWFWYNWDIAMNSGQLNDVIEDKTGGLFTQVMSVAAKK